tara:strand:- start:21183 stop:21353 length:171 start_codon:yes stop_codon:yes gene_type:complete
MEIKKGQKINNEIPMDTWYEFEDLYLREKMSNKNKLNKKDFFIRVFEKGVREWPKK